MSSEIFINLIVVFSAALTIGTIVRYVVPGRVKHGLMLVPAFAIVFALLVWEICVWAGLPAEWTQLAWLILLVLTAGVTVVFTLWLTRRRNTEDAAALNSALARIRTL